MKIADFGLAKLLGKRPSDPTLTGVQQAMGTLHYMAPEQMRGAGSVDHRADIYSLGVVFYELLTGQLPVGRFQLPSESKQVDERLDTIIMKALEQEPDARYQRANDVKTDIDTVTSVGAEPQADIAPRGVDNDGAKPPMSPECLQPPLKPTFGRERTSRLSLAGRPASYVLVAVGIFLVAAGGVFTVLHYRLWEKPVTIRYKVTWDSPEKVSQRDLEALEAVVNRRLMGEHDQPFASVDTAGSRLAPDTNSDGASELVISFRRGQATTELQRLARRRLSIRGTCQVRILVDRQLDTKIIEQLAETTDDSATSDVIELADGTTVCWLPVHYTSIISLENSDRAVTRHRPGAGLGDRLEVLALVGTFQLDERHIASARIGTEAEFDDVLQLAFRPQAKVAWRRLLARYSPRIDSFFPSRRRDGRQLALVLDGELRTAKLVASLFEDDDVMIDFGTDGESLHHWAIALQSGPLPATLSDMTSAPR